MKILNDIRESLLLVKQIRLAQVREAELKDATRHSDLLSENTSLKNEVERVRKAYSEIHKSISKNVTDAGLFRAIITDSVVEIELPK